MFIVVKLDFFDYKAILTLYNTDNAFFISAMGKSFPAFLEKAGQVVTVFARPTVRQPVPRSRAGSYGRAFAPAPKTAM